MLSQSPHLGADTASAPWTSTDVIKNTTGIDALLDGHAHELFVKSVKNKDGKSIKMVATGTKLENIGKIVIAENGAITAEYIGADVAKDKDADVAKFIDSIKAKYDALVKTVVAKTDVDLIIADQKENRLVRSEETILVISARMRIRMCWALISRLSTAAVFAYRSKKAISPTGISSRYIRTGTWHA